MSYRPLAYGLLIVGFAIFVSCIGFLSFQVNQAYRNQTAVIGLGIGVFVGFFTFASGSWLLRSIRRREFLEVLSRPVVVYHAHSPYQQAPQTVYYQ
jgi:NhaP-type Na+/H+ or K+/H+ antiporter